MKMEIVSQADAGKCLDTYEDRKDWDALISIGDPNSATLKHFDLITPHLRLEFHDVWGKFKIPGELAPDKQSIAKLIMFGRKLQLNPMPGKCLIHCHAGMSRSPAAGFILNCIWMGPGKEDEAMSLTLNSCRETWAFPNNIMIELADDLLKRNGKMNDSLHYNKIIQARMY